MLQIRPYFLTANHVYEQARPVRNVTGWRFTFQAWSGTCPYPGINSDGVTYNGSTFRASWAGSDFCLVELNNTPPSNSGINYAGWNRNTVGITQTTIIHHPRGDVMKITRDNDAPVAVVHPDINNLNCWRLIVENGNGATEGGSSGSPYFDQNHRIIAQHFGISNDQLNLPVCNQFTKYGGRFDLSWTGGGTNTTRLSNWLDPNNSGAITTNTTNISLLTLVNFSISGDNTVCSTSNNYTIPNLPTGATVTWSASPSGIVSINSPNSSQTTLTKINNGFITLTATIANVCGGNNIVINRQVGVGYTQIMHIGYPSSTVAPDELIPMQIFIAPDSLVMGNQKLVIKRTGGGYNDSIYTGGDGAVEFSFSMTGTYNIKVYTYNDCGWSTNYYPLVFFCTSDGMFMLSPNPANTALTVKLNDETMQAGNEKNNAIGIKEIQLTDKMGTVLKRYVYSGTDKQVTMDVSALKADIYYIRVFNGKQWQGKSFIKQ